MMAFYQRFIWGGITWHPDVTSGLKSNPLAITIGAEYKRFRLGYTFDLGLGKVNDIAATSHEFVVSYSIERKKTATISTDGEFFELFCFHNFYFFVVGKAWGFTLRFSFF
jgi:hypothetical protein